MNYSSFQIIQYEDAYIELFELHPCNNKQELEKKEGEYIRNMECVNKMKRPYTTEEEKKEKKEKDNKEWYEKNKIEYNKKRREDIEQKEKLKEKVLCTCGSNIRKGKY